VDEILRHLLIIDQHAKELYQSSGNEGEALTALSSGYSIICSGKGSNERISFKKEFKFGGSTYELTCNPHTKLFNAYSNARIYFCWGRDDIKDHDIIIVHIGGHWN